MPTRPSRALYLCAATLAASLAGCAANRLRAVAPPSAPRLAGDWTLDAANSEHLDAAVRSLEAQLHKLVREARRPADRAELRRPERGQPGRDGDQDEGAPPGAASASDASPVQEPSVEVSAPMLGASWIREFITRVPVGHYLGIRLTPTLVSVRSADGSRQCSLGVPTAITFGHDTANETCGWQGPDFLIELRPLIGPRLTERFALGPGGELVMTLRLRGKGIDVRLIRRYRRTPHAAAPVLLPTSD